MILFLCSNFVGSELSLYLNFIYITIPYSLGLMNITFWSLKALNPFELIYWLYKTFLCTSLHICLNKSITEIRSIRKHKWPQITQKFSEIRETKINSENCCAPKNAATTAVDLPPIQCCEFFATHCLWER